MQIAMISEHASPLASLGGVDSGGQNVYIAQTARHLVRLGHRVDVYTRRDSVELPEIVATKDGYRVINVPAGPPTYVAKEDLLPYMAPFASYMTQKLRRNPVDLVHANFFMSGLIAMRIKQQLDIPFVITFHALGRVRLLHQPQADRFPHERLAIEDEIVATADAILAECPQDAEDQITLYGAEAQRLRVIPCGFDPEELAPVDKRAARRHLGLDPEEPLVLQLGRMVPRKGVGDAVRGFARMVRYHGVNGRLMIVGGESDEPDPQKTPEIGRLQRIANEERIADRVWFAGRANRAELKYYYSAADVFVTMPWYEPFGITPLEAMACGTPVIGSNVGGIKFSVCNRYTGFLVPPRDAGALGNRLAALISQPALRARMGRRSLERVRKHFTWRGVAKQISQVYRDVLCSTAPAAFSAETESLRRRATSTSVPLAVGDDA
jgi:glycosyltransferase involved in cell wall biosynthesis